MKHILKNLILYSAISLFLQFSLKAQVRFERGVNLTNWFQTSGAKQIQFTKYTKQDFENIKSLGCDIIRLPINLFYMTGGEPDYVLDTIFLGFLDQAVSWAEESEIYLIIDNHSTDDVASRNPNLQSVLVNVWAQMAEHYKNRSEYVLYEIMNEPNGITTQVWGGIQQAAINTIRAIDTVHHIVVGASAFNGFNDLKLLPVYSDKKLIYTFHFYEPFIFTHQGASWPVPSLAPLTKVPFPYVADSMPPLPNALKGTWIESSYNNYSQNGTVAKIKELIDIAASFKNSRNVEVYCGELGVYMPFSTDTNRNYWYSEVTKYLEEKDIPWTIWDYKGGFGIFKQGSNEMFDYDLNVSLVNSLGLNAPPQLVYEIKPDTVGFNIYQDFIGEGIFESGNAAGGVIDFYSDENPNNGEYAISWTGSAQYGTIGFNFIPDKDMSKLVSENYAVSLIVRGNKPGTKIDLRFIDSKTSDPGDHPWRMNYTLDEAIMPLDGRWHKIFIPLSDFVDQGSWDNAWYSPVGAFDWHAVDRFEIVTETGSLVDKKFWFDNILVSNLDTAQIFDTTAVPVISGFQNKYMDAGLIITPNPVISIATIHYSLSTRSEINISVFNLSGQRVKSVLNMVQEPGFHSVFWNAETDNGTPLPNGIYICRYIVSGNVTSTLISIAKNN